MSVSMYQNNVNRLDKEITDLEARKAKLDSDSANLESRILSVEKTITKNISLSSLQDHFLESFHRLLFVFHPLFATCCYQNI